MDEKKLKCINELLAYLYLYHPICLDSSTLTPHLLFSRQFIWLAGFKIGMVDQRMNYRRSDHNKFIALKLSTYSRSKHQNNSWIFKFSSSSSSFLLFSVLTIGQLNVSLNNGNTTRPDSRYCRFISFVITCFYYWSFVCFLSCFCIKILFELKIMQYLQPLSPSSFSSTRVLL